MNFFAAAVDPRAIDESSFPRAAGGAEKLRFLLRCAVLAPSTRNTQPWKFRVSDGPIEIFVDPARWQRIADHAQRELYLSIGCAREDRPTSPRPRQAAEIAHAAARAGRRAGVNSAHAGAGRALREQCETATLPRRRTARAL